MYDVFYVEVSSWFRMVICRYTAGSGWPYVDTSTNYSCGNASSSKEVAQRWSSAKRELDGDSSRTRYQIRGAPVQKAHEQFILRIQSINSMMSLPLIMVSTIQSVEAALKKVESSKKEGLQRLNQAKQNVEEQVKVQTWVNGVEDEEFVGVGVRFGFGGVKPEKYAILCYSTENSLHRVVYEELYKMVCEPDETDLDIHIPAVMLPEDAGATLEKMLSYGSSVSVQRYSPRRSVVDIAEVFLWLMAVGTILCASYWSAWSAREAAIEQDKLLKDATDELPNIKSPGGSSVVDINTTSAILFVVVASCFLILIYKTNC
ncbi:UNVERIFIED_CONTAM: Signal peptide peptidase-like 2 [Sesamum latifolium]|uniref:Signal peptide peptidase-like 2 n=1 Tax=Sesamum latifolium TaxID=2727402 RepID=A0AAW2STH8_9LAMI